MAYIERAARRGKGAAIDTLLQCLLGAALGTAAMTISSETEMALSQREASDAPGNALSTIQKWFTGKPLEGRALKVASTWGHWLYGVAWGVVLFLLIDEDFASLPLWLAGVVFGVIVWLAAQAVQPTLAGAKPTPAYGLKATMTDLWHHAVYAAATTVSLWLIQVSCGID